MSAVFEGESPVESPHIAGNDSDDDAEYIEDLFRQVPEPPAAIDRPTARETLPNAPLITPNRMIARTGQFTGPMVDPILIFPADVNRKRLYITANATMYIAGDKIALPRQMGVLTFDPSLGLSFQVYANMEIVDYTGAVWMISSPSVGAATTWQYSFLSITE